MREKKFIFLTILSCFVLVTASLAQQGMRYSDDEVKKMIEQAADTSDDFDDAFDKVERITTRTGVPVDVRQYMEDYEETFKRFKEGFESKGEVNTDLVNLFRMTGEIDGVMTRNPDAAGAGSEWQAHKFNMERLAQAFRTSLDEGAGPPHRLSDNQVGAIMEDLVANSKTLGKSVKDAMKKDQAFDESTRKSVEQSIKSLEKKAETLKDLFEDNKPLNVELQGFLTQLDSIKSFLTENPLTSEVQSNWQRLEKNAGRLSTEYNLI
jgi:hypothetical protein